MILVQCPCGGGSLWPKHYQNGCVRAVLYADAVMEASERVEVRQQDARLRREFNEVQRQPSHAERLLLELLACVVPSHDARKGLYTAVPQEPQHAKAP